MKKFVQRIADLCSENKRVAMLSIWMGLLTNILYFQKTQ